MRPKKGARAEDDERGARRHAAARARPLTGRGEILRSAPRGLRIAATPDLQTLLDINPL
jgi:hypothetical protein